MPIFKIALKIAYLNEEKLAMVPHKRDSFQKECYISRKGSYSQRMKFL
jgi:hypothetical protein